MAIRLSGFAAWLPLTSSVTGSMSIGSMSWYSRVLRDWLRNIFRPLRELVEHIRAYRSLLPHRKVSATEAFLIASPSSMSIWIGLSIQLQLIGGQSRHCCVRFQGCFVVTSWE